jgi:multicomponent Na+:H+ antiporter subunit C
MTQFVLAVVLGLLFAFGTYLVLRRDVVRVVWGVTIIGQAANVYLVTMGGLVGGVPILAHGHGGGGAVTDPLVQALVLTAIVIGFGTTAFALALTFRVYEAHGTIDTTELANSGSSGDEPAAGQPTATDGGSADGEPADDATDDQPEASDGDGGERR